MRKGNEKRRQILAVAEKLFYSKGYDETSVQDILDVLHISKGNFYYHFESKDQVLELLCHERAERAAATAVQAISDKTDPMVRLGVVLQYAMPLRKDELPFLILALPLMFRPEGRTIRACYEDALTEVFMPPIMQELEQAAGAETILPGIDPRVAEVVLSVLNRCWLTVARSLYEHPTAPAEPAELLDRLELYREAIERLLDAPYGSIELVRLSEWQQVITQLRQRIQLPMNG